ncbi:tumor necrosis factor receptor superfamily member 9 [Lissotriton helveticus]
MESSCDIMSVVLLLLALVTGCIAKPGCQGKADVTCPAGTFFSSGSCKCEDCPEHTFSNKNGMRPLTCSRCKQCEGIFQYKVRCSRTQDAQCECKPGLRCSGMECDYCHKNCEHGEEPTENGCRKCPPESFNNETNGSCKPWTNCLSKGLEVLVNGSTSSDAVCSSPFVTVVIPVAGVSEGKNIAYHVIIAGSVFFFMCVICPFMVMVAWVKKKVKNGFKQIPAQIVKTAEAEDGCSCHYPEEEVGGPVTQDP